MLALVLLLLVPLVTPAEATNTMCYGVAYAGSAVQHWKNVIAIERSNPGGVVDMELLHDAGRQIQCWQRYSDAFKAEFRSSTGRAADLKMCLTSSARPSWDAGVIAGADPVNCE